MSTISQVTTQKKKEYIQSLKVQIEEWHDEITQWEEETSRFSAETRLDYLKAIAGLRHHWQQLRMYSDKLETTDDNESWETTWLRCLEVIAEYKYDFQALIRQALQDQQEGNISPTWLQSFIDAKKIADAVAAAEPEPAEKVWHV